MRRLWRDLWVLGAAAVGFGAAIAAVAASPDGFSYYATLRDNATGETTTLPAAGAAAPQNSYPIADATTVDLGPHRFGATRAPDARVVRAAWGAGAAEAGLSGGPG